LVWTNYADTGTRRDSSNVECGDTAEVGNTIFFERWAASCRFREALSG